MRVWAVMATLTDLPESARLKMLVGRMGTYLQAYGDALVTINGWDPAVLQRFRSAPQVTEVRGSIDAVATPSQLEAIAELIPDEWLGDEPRFGRRQERQLTRVGAQRGVQVGYQAGMAHIVGLGALVQLDELPERHREPVARHGLPGYERTRRDHRMPVIREPPHHVQLVPLPGSLRVGVGVRGQHGRHPDHHR